MAGLFDLIYGNPQQDTQQVPPLKKATQKPSGFRSMTMEEVEAARRLTNNGVTDTGDETQRLMARTQTPMAQATAGQNYLPEDSRYEMAQEGVQPVQTGMPDYYSQSMGGQLANAQDAARNETKETDWAGLLGAVGQGLMIAGSPDPAKTYSTLMETERANSSAKSPKVTPLQGGAFSMISMPGGRTEIVRNDQVADFIQNTAGANFMQKLALQNMAANNQMGMLQYRADLKAAEESRPLLQQLQSLKGRLTSAQDIVNKQGTSAQFQGMFPWLSGALGLNEVANNLQLQGVKISETLLNTAETKGAISNAEMQLFMSPIPSLSDDRETVWKPWLEARIKVLEKAEKILQEQASRGQRPGLPAAPAPATTNGSTPVPSAVNNTAQQIMPQGHQFFTQR